MIENMFTQLPTPLLLHQQCGALSAKRGADDETDAFLLGGQHDVGDSGSAMHSSISRVCPASGTYPTWRIPTREDARRSCPARPGRGCWSRKGLAAGKSNRQRRLR